MNEPEPDHYATLGLHRRCTAEEIRNAYRLLAKLHHPDLNPDSPDATSRAQALNEANEVLSDPERRRAYDRELKHRESAPKNGPSGRIEKNVTQDVMLRVEDFLRGVSLEVRVNDPGNPNGPETYALDIPPDTAPGARFRLPRSEPFDGGVVIVRVKPSPGRLKVRGSDLRTDLKISAQKAAQGGSEMVFGASGGVRVQIPKGVARGATLRVPGEGMPKPRGGRGDLLIRVTYRPEVKIARR